MTMRKEKNKVLSMMDDIRKKKDKNKAPYIVETDYWQLYADEKRNPIKAMEGKRTKYMPMGGDKPSARKTRVLGPGKGIQKHGTGLIEEEMGGKTTAHQYVHPAFRKKDKNGR